MRLKILSFLLFTAPWAFSQSRIQPAISPNGIVNAGSYIAAGFANHGIARGSLFLIFGSNLGPDTLVQATTYPLAGTDGLAGTRVHIDAGGYSAFALMVYTSATQVAAMLPSNAPEGDATITLNYNNLTSNPIVIHVVRSAFGMFTVNQGGSGPAILQNFVSAGQTPVNTLTTPATPGQTVILWGTGLGPVTGDEGGGPLPGALPYLDTLYVGGIPATVRYAGRSGCCVAVDQVVFDVPAGVSGCYVPVVAMSGGLVSNFGTIAIAASGSTCDDPLSFRTAALATLQRTGRLRVGQVSLSHESAPGTLNGTNTLSGTFAAYTPQTLMTAFPVNPSLGSCYATQSLIAPNPAVPPQGESLNAGPGITSTGPSGALPAAQIGSGKYLGSASPADLLAGPYALTSSGGADVGALQSNFTVAAPGQWTNTSDYTAPIATGQPLTFRWTGGDPNGSVRVQITASSTTLSTSIVCNAPATAGSLTVPAYATRLLVQGGATISMTFSGASSSFAASGLDVGVITSGTSAILQTSFRTPPATAPL